MSSVARRPEKISLAFHRFRWTLVAFLSTFILFCQLIQMDYRSPIDQSGVQLQKFDMVVKIFIDKYFWPLTNTNRSTFLTKQAASLGSIREKTLYKRHSDCNLHNKVNHQYPKTFFNNYFPSSILLRPTSPTCTASQAPPATTTPATATSSKSAERWDVWGLGGCGAVAWVSEWVEAMERRPREEVNMELLRIL